MNNDIKKEVEVEVEEEKESKYIKKCKKITEEESIIKKIMKLSNEIYPAKKYNPDEEKNLAKNSLDMLKKIYNSLKQLQKNKRG